MARLVRTGETYGFKDISDAEALTLAEICIESIITIIRGKEEYPHVVELLARVALEAQTNYEVKSLSEEDYKDLETAIKIYKDPEHARDAVKAHHLSVERRILL